MQTRRDAHSCGYAAIGSRAMADATVPKSRSPRPTRSQLVGIALAILLVGAVFVFVLPRIAGYRDVWSVLRGLSARDLAFIAGATLLNVVTFAPPWMAALPGLGFWQALALTQASTALSIVSPAGAAVGMAGSYTLLRSWGFERGRVGLAVAVTGAWNQLATLVFPIVALALLTAVNERHPALQTAAFLGVAVLAAVVALFAAALSSADRARGIGSFVARLVTGVRRLARRPPVLWGGDSLASFRSRTLDLLRRRWHVLTVSTLVGHLTVFLVLVVCLRTLGVSGEEVSLVEAFAAWALIRILGALPLTPAGLGFVELGLSGALVAFGASNPDAVAVTLLYRFVTVTPTFVLGLAAVATWRMHDRRLPV
jgi:putative heme transporter